MNALLEHLASDHAWSVGGIWENTAAVVVCMATFFVGLNSATESARPFTFLVWSGIFKCVTPFAVDTLVRWSHLRVLLRRPQPSNLTNATVLRVKVDSVLWSKSAKKVTTVLQYSCQADGSCADKAAVGTPTTLDAAMPRLGNSASSALASLVAPVGMSSSKSDTPLLLVEEAPLTSPPPPPPPPPSAMDTQGSESSSLDPEPGNENSAGLASTEANSSSSVQVIRKVFVTYRPYHSSLAEHEGATVPVCLFPGHSKSGTPLVLLEQSVRRAERQIKKMLQLLLAATLFAVILTLPAIQLVETGIFWSNESSVLPAAIFILLDTLVTALVVMAIQVRRQHLLYPFLCGERSTGNATLLLFWPPGVSIRSSVHRPNEPYNDNELLPEEEDQEEGNALLPGTGSNGSNGQVHDNSVEMATLG